MSALTEHLTSLARDLILIPSTDRNPAGRRRAFEFFLHHLQGLDGVIIQRYESNGYESLVATPGGEAHPEVLLCGHLDVIEHPPQDQYAPTIREGKIYGPGAGDMKGALAILLKLFLKNHRQRPGTSLGLAITSDEEIGGMHGLRYLVEEQGLRCQLAIIPDGGSPAEITIAEKGILHLRVHCQGRAAHAARPWLGKNSLHHLLARLQPLISHFETLRPPSITGRDHWYPTCAVTQIFTPNTSINRIPGRAEALVDIRFPPPDSVPSMSATVDTLLGRGDALKTNTIISAEPTELDPDPAFLAITEQVTGRPVTRVRASGGSDARFLCAHGIPVLLSRPFVGNLHANDEWIDIASMETYFTICDRYLEERFKGGD